jgi:group I intron endonuclease
MYDIYEYTNLINNKKYVGQSIDKDTRRRQHLYEAKRGSTCPFHRAIRKYGIDNFSFRIIESVDTQKGADDQEDFWINELDTRSRDRGYNLRGGGIAGLLAEESKQKISNSLTEYYSDEKNRETIRDSLKNYYEQNPDRVEKIREESRENIKERKRNDLGQLLPSSGVPVPEKTPEEKKAINKRKSEMMLSKSPEEKARISKKLSDAQKARYAAMTPEEKEAFCKRKREISVAYHAKKKSGIQCTVAQENS